MAIAVNECLMLAVDVVNVDGIKAELQNEIEDMCVLKVVCPTLPPSQKCY